MCGSNDAATVTAPALHRDAQVAGDDADNDGGEDDAGGPTAPPTVKTVLDLQDVKAHPEKYEWFDFRPNVKKLILAGAAETKHIAILWYTTPDGGVGLHYHANTESVYVIDGTQTDAKGSYPSGTAYFNPPGSGHQITKSSGFFILAYASPPDFANTSAIGEYTPVRLDTTPAALSSAYEFVPKGKGVATYSVPLDAKGGMTAELTQLKAASSYKYKGNYVLVLAGECTIDGTKHGPSQLVVTKAVEPLPYKLAAAEGGSCTTLNVSF
jgi:hypothetical protein